MLNTQAATGSTQSVAGGLTQTPADTPDAPIATARAPPVRIRAYTFMHMRFEIYALGVPLAVATWY